MKLLPVSPVEFRKPISKLPDRVYITEVAGSRGRVSLAATVEGFVSAAFDVPIDRFATLLRKRRGVTKLPSGIPFTDTIDDLARYLDGECIAIRAVVQPVGVTPFILDVHRLLARIPCGETLTYGEIAALLNRPGAARAVGGACGRNNVPVIVPCHRVLATGGLGGFGAGLPAKMKLLALEGIEW